MNKYEITLEPSTYYHIYNRAIGNANLFYTERNYSYFLKRYQEYISPVADTYTYCLMPNHFHFLIRIRGEREVQGVKENQASPALKNVSNSLYVSKQFSNLFNGYSQAINKQESRKGNLFCRPFKRKEINSEEYLRNLTLYIHLNPIHHGFTKHVGQWSHCSYKSIISNVNKELKRNEVISWFDDLENFTKAHERHELNKAMVQEIDELKIK